MSSDSDNDRVKELFNTCDLDSSGFIDRAELAAVVDLDDEALDEIFKQLDKDGDGRISIEEFTENYRKCKCIASQVEQRRTERDESDASPVNGSSESSSSPEKRGKSTYRPNSFLRAHDTGVKMYRRKKPWKRALSQGQDHLEEIYSALEKSDNPALLHSLEKFVAATVDSVRQKQSENEKLDSALRRASEKNSELARSLEDEMEQQICVLQEKIRDEEKHRAEKYIEEAMQAIVAKDSEIDSISEKVAVLEKALQEEPGKSNEIVKEIENRQEENKVLNSQLREYQTQLALLRSEVSFLKGEYDEQGNRLDKERTTVLQCVSEQENLTRQLHLLHEANRRLHDTNDDLRAALESKRQSSRFDRSSRSPSPTKTASTPFNYLRRSSNGSLRSELPRQQSANSPGMEHMSRVDDDVNEASLLSELAAADDEFRDLSRSFDEDDEAYNSMPKSERQQFVKQLQILFDTNKRLSKSNDELRAALSLIRRRSSKKRVKRRSSRLSRVSSNHSDYASGPGSEAESISRHQPDDSEGVPKGTSSPLRSHRSKDNSLSSTDNSIRSSDTSGINSSYSVLQNLENELSMYAKRDPDEEYDEDDMEEDELVRLVDMTTGSDSESDHGNKTVEERVPAAGADARSEAFRTPLPIDATPERMYKLVLAGNAAVGKSSFILRLCKNKFYSSLNSTLGVDFQMKTVNVDGHVAALQLWDTAGQERFRSIAKSYFRKVDGVLLLYDVTCETSFKDVRSWIESVEDGATRPVPIIICGNKIDLRKDCAARGKRVISRKQGESLAKEFGALFIETSAKEGSNIEGACLELARQLWKMEDSEVKQGGIELKDGSKNATKKSRCCS